MSITDDHFKQGVEAYASRNYDAAESAFKKVLEIEPYSSESLLNLGNVYFKRNNLPEAESYWQKAIQMNPLEDKAYLNLGNLYFGQKAYGKAISFWTIFQKLCPTHGNVCLNLGLAYEAIALMPEAYQYFNHFIAVSRGDKEAIKLKSRMAEAERIAEHNLKQAEKLMHNGQLVKAREAYDNSVKLVPVSPKVYKHYATVLYQLGQYMEASRWYENAYRYKPGDTGILINLGVIYEKLEDHFMALWAYWSAINSDPKGISGKVKQRYDALWKQYGTTLLDNATQRLRQQVNRMQYDDAQKLANRVFEVVFALAPEKLPEVQGIRTFLEERQDPTLLAANIAYSMGEDYRESGQYEKAMYMYDRYIDLMPMGDRVGEVKQKREQLEKTISAVIGSLLSGGGASPESLVS
jgi:tetratricopeptide (TPR) repeat protein